MLLLGEGMQEGQIVLIQHGLPLDDPVNYCLRVLGTFTITPSPSSISIATEA